MLKKIAPYFLALLSGIIISVVWFLPLPNWITLFSLIPLLFAERILSNADFRKPLLQKWLIGFLYYFSLNVCSLWWLSLLLTGWSYLYFAYISILFSLFFLLFVLIKNKMGEVLGYVSFITLFMAFDFITLKLNFAFPALNFGVLVAGADQVALIQWYEYTGSFGGALWLLLSNVLVFELITHWHIKRLNVKLLVASLLAIFLPMVISLIIFYSYDETNKPIEVVAVQPNFSPDEKNFLSKQAQADRLISLALNSVTSETDLIIFPETALDSNIWLNNINEHTWLRDITDTVLKTCPHAKLISGINMMEYYHVIDGKAPSSSAVKITDEYYYDFFNAAFLSDSSHKFVVYKKNNLVFGTEYVPFENTFPWMKDFSMSIGGSGKGRGRNLNPKPIKTDIGNIAPIMCYDALFGNDVARLIRKGADIACCMANDNFWNGTPGQWLPCRMSQLRAIENRRDVVRCANTGISAIINQKGQIVAKAEWGTPTALKGNVNKNKKITFYTQYGDYLGYLAISISALLTLSILAPRPISLSRLLKIKNK